MKKYFLIILTMFAIVSKGYAQDKDTEHLEALYSEKKYEKIKDYKSKKLKKLSSEALYIKGMAHYMTQEDQKALDLFDAAIKKGPATHDMYYYKSVSEYYVGKPEAAILSIDKAIELNSDEASFYSLKGQLHQSIKDFSNAEVAFKNALDRTHITEVAYADIQYNMGLSQQLSGNYEAAKATFEECLKLSPDDYQTMTKLVQVMHAMDLIEASMEIKTKLYDGHKREVLPDHMKTMFCFEQFKWNKVKVMSFEAFDANTEENVTWKHKFFILDKKGEIDYKIQTELDKELSIFKPVLIKEGVRSVYANYTYKDLPDYKLLKEAIEDILNNFVQPESTDENYGVALDAKDAEKTGLSGLELDGSSFKKAIKVNSVSEEYAWLKKYYPGSSFQGQSLKFEDKKPFDVLTIITANGTTKEIHFDISSFFGKGF